MKRSHLLLSALLAIIVVAGWWFLLYSPRSEEITEVQASTDEVIAQQSLLRTRIAALREVRENAPEVEAQLAASESILPHDTDLPSALRQLQLAANESNATLVATTPSRPEPLVPDAAAGAAPATDGDVAAPATASGLQLHRIPLHLEFHGGYFQILDALRRLEDPAISPRGMVWTSFELVINEEEGAPALIATVAGDMYTLLPAGTMDPEGAAAAEAAPPAEGDEADGDQGEDGDAQTDTGDAVADDEVAQ